jgi:hypothetical protein
VVVTKRHAERGLQAVRPVEPSLRSYIKWETEGSLEAIIRGYHQRLPSGDFIRGRFIILIEEKNKREKAELSGSREAQQMVPRMG